SGRVNLSVGVRVRRAFPRRDRAGDTAEQRMAARLPQRLQARMAFGVTHREFRQQVCPFARELAVSHRDRLHRPLRPDLAAVEGIATRRGLRVQAGEVGADCEPRRGMRMKTLQLRVPGVAARLPAAHRARQQRLAPRRPQAPAVEVSGMERPQAADVAPAPAQPNSLPTMRSPASPTPMPVPRLVRMKLSTTRVTRLRYQPRMVCASSRRARYSP